MGWLLSKRVRRLPPSAGLQPQPSKPRGASVLAARRRRVNLRSKSKPPDSRAVADSPPGEDAPRIDSLCGLVDRLAGYRHKPAVLAFRKEGLQSCTYSEVARSADHLARGLVKAGMSKGDAAAVWAAPTAEWISACLAVIRAGGTVVPLDTQLDDEVLGDILADCSPRWVFADGGGMQRLEKLHAAPEFEPVLLDGDGDDGRSWRQLTQIDGEKPPACSPEDRAALFYTSGTTGPPKGVPLTHENLAFQLNTLARTGLVNESDRILLPLPLHHVYPLVIGVLAPLSFGVPIIIPRALTGPQILKAAKQGRATILIGVPRLLESLYDGIESRFRSRSRRAAELFNTIVSCCGLLRERTGFSVGRRLFWPLHRSIGPGLTVLASGGSALDESLSRRLEGLGWLISVGYGLTETAPLLTLDPPGKARIGSVGRTVPGVEVRIDPSAEDGDGGDRNAAEKASGEIQVRGPNVFSGYHNLPAKTEEGFTDDGWFRTGDLGHFDDDGYLYVDGRLSTLIVTGAGENIQPDEVEDAYSESDMIEEVGIFQKEDRLAAVIVPDAEKLGNRGSEDMARAVGEHIEARSERLPSYQRVSDFVLSREPLERTRLGKIKRHLLPERYERERRREDSDSRDEEPISPQDMSGRDRRLMENRAVEKLWDLMARRYSDRHLTPDTDLHTELGIDSMEWLNLTMEISRETGIELDDETIGAMATVRDLLQAVDAASEAGSAAEGKASLFEEPETILSERQKRWLEPLGPRKVALARWVHGVNRFAVRRILALDVKGRGHLPGDANFILTPNHVSYLDPFALAAALDFEVMRRTFWGGWTGAAFANPFNRFVSRLAQAVPIDPEKGVLSSLAFSAAVLKRGENMVWFPEGRRSPTGKLQQFKPGIGRLLSHVPVTVVPVLIQGTGEVLPPGKFVKRLRPVRLVFDQPLDPRELARDGGDDDADRITQAIFDRIDQMSQRHATED